MARALTRSHKAFALALIATVAVAFLPARWLGWVGDVADVVRVPFTPFGHLGQAARGWLRPQVNPALRTGDEELDRVHLENLQRLERRNHALELRIRELEEQLEQVQRIRVERAAALRVLSANVTGVDRASVTRSVEINRGARHRVEPGAIAVYGGVYLLGRVVDVRHVRSEVMPLAGIEHIEARILPRERPAGEDEASITAAPKVLLESRGDGTFTAQLRVGEPAGEGDIVRLADPGWPRAAQAMIIGTVESIRRRDDQPLFNLITVRPSYSIHHLATIALMIEADGEAAP